MEEIWKDIQGYENIYQISSYGRVRSLHFGKERIMKQRLRKDGRLDIMLCNDGIYTMAYVHRLVATAFIDNPDCLPEVNHKDEDPQNNHVENLEWCTGSYNHNYGTRNSRQAKALEKPVLQYDMNGKFIKEYESIKKAGFENHIDPSSIAKACKGKYKHSGNYIWKYKF